MAQVPKSTYTVHINSPIPPNTDIVSVSFGDPSQPQVSDNMSWAITPQGHTILPSGVSINGAQVGSGALPLTAVGFGPGGCVVGVGNGLFDPPEAPWSPNVKCAAGHRCSTEFTEYVDGEIVSTCEGCGERIILPRVPGAVPLLRLKAFIGGLMGLVVGDEDDDYDFAELLCDYADIKRAIATEDDAASRSQSLIKIADKLIQQKLAEQPV